MKLVAKAVAAGNIEWLRGWLYKTFQVDLPAETVGKLVKKAMDENIGCVATGQRIMDLNGKLFMSSEYFDDDWRMWFSNRLRELLVWPHAPNRIPLDGWHHARNERPMPFTGKRANDPEQILRTIADQYACSCHAFRHGS